MGAGPLLWTQPPRQDKDTTLPIHVYYIHIDAWLQSRTWFIRYRNWPFSTAPSDRIEASRERRCQGTADRQVNKHPKGILSKNRIHTLRFYLAYILNKPLDVYLSLMRSVNYRPSAPTQHTQLNTIS